MQFAGFAITLLDIIVASVFFTALIVGTVADRRGHEALKWWVFGVGIIVVSIIFWKDWSFAGTPREDGTPTLSLWGVLHNWAFWKPVIYYLLLGIIYSGLEFGIEIFRTVRSSKKAWKDYLATKSPRTTEEQRVSAVNDFMLTRWRWKAAHPIIDLVAVGEEIQPHVNKSELAQAIGCWTLFWPAYAISLIIGDVLAEIWNWLSALFIALSGRFVRYSFRDVFKF